MSSWFSLQMNERSFLPFDRESIIALSCRPMPGQPRVTQPRPAQYWPVDALVLAERLLGRGDQTY